MAWSISVVFMKSDVYLRSQLQDIILGLATTANWLPAVASSDEAEFFHAGFLAALNAVAVSLSMEIKITPIPHPQNIRSHNSSDATVPLIE